MIRIQQYLNLKLKELLLKLTQQQRLKLSRLKTKFSSNIGLKPVL